MKKIIAKEILYNRLEQLLIEYEIIGPKESPNKGIFYHFLKNSQDLYLREGFAVEPAKKFFLSPSECIFKGKFEGKSYHPEDITLPETKRIMIGIRPCEAKGLTLLDKLFDPSTSAGAGLNGMEQINLASVYKDNLYINNRKRTVIVGLACSRPDKSCFCVSMGGSPTDARGMDALLFNNENKFIAEILTARGEELLGSLGEGLNEDEKKSLEKRKEETTNLVTKKIRISKKMDETFESDYWRQVSQPCISCGICTYLCPTCHCFDLVDEKRNRLRCYDGCSFPDFTLETSGENPRPTKKERYRQRVFHKFNYFQKNFGEQLCVACGRCIRYCPVKMDIADIAEKAHITESK